MRINPSAPASWQDLQNDVAQILRECGLTTETDKPIETAREVVNVDVFAEDQTQQPPIRYICECKHWKSRVPKTIIHAFRSVVADSGMNCGFVISSGGFQSGAIEASQYTNLRLVTWNQFEEVFADRWVRRMFGKHLPRETESLGDYAEPLLSDRVYRRAQGLNNEAKGQFRELRLKWCLLSELVVGFQSPYYGVGLTTSFAGSGRASEFRLPLCDVLEPGIPLPAEILSANSLRGLFDAIVLNTQLAVAEFDDLFGGRV